MTDDIYMKLFNEIILAAGEDRSKEILNRLFVLQSVSNIEEKVNSIKDHVNPKSQLYNRIWREEEKLEVSFMKMRREGKAITKQRKFTHGVPWTQDEHIRLLASIKVFGRDWKKIA